MKLLGPARGSRGWLSAALKALAMVGVIALVFAVVPDLIAEYLDGGRASGDVRDIILLAWFAFGIVAVPWALAWLQKRGLL